MYLDLCCQFWWRQMKKDTALFILRCLNYQQVKVKHQKPIGLLQPLLVAEWKWKHITMDFVSDFPRSLRWHNTIWVMVNYLTKFMHFLPIHLLNLAKDLGINYIREIIRLYRVPVSIISNRDSRFTSLFWKGMQLAVGSLETQHNISSSD